ncbi:hypothetical protein [Nocardia brasiliensis]|uniref:hypothetical protein n=1 Tax=Nocardia brasiliensis TaxID=37326 RepID=UPI002455CFB0|nr:hypothetical protein [Nocardia brasiliensis]
MSFPVGAPYDGTDYGASADGSIPGLSTRTQEAVTDQLKSTVGDGRWGQIEGGIFAIIAAAIDAILGGFGTVLEAIDDVVSGMIIAMLRALADVLGETPIIGDTLEELVDGIADFLNATDATASNAQSTATSAQSTATAAQSAATAAQSTATAAQTAASNAASVAAAAQATADIAYDYGTYREKEFAVTTSGLVLGKNETVLGILLPVPPDSIVKITRLIYTMQTNTGTVAIQLIRRALNGTESVVWTTNVTAGAIVFSDNGIDYEVTDLDHYLCNITAIGGVVTALHCCIEYVILPAA